MLHSQKYVLPLVLLFLGVLFLGFLNISLGSVNIPFKDVFASIFNLEVSKETWRYIIVEYRLPKAITAIITGSGLAISGLLMQTLFRNPLAGPYVLGLSSGASLGVAIVIMGASIFGGVFAGVLLSKWSLVIASSLGSLLVLMAVILASIKLRDTMAILIIGLMFASLTAAVVSVLSYFSPAAQLQQYIFWSFGSLGDLSWNEVGILTIFWLVGLALAMSCIKNLDTLLLGEQYAKSLGVSIKRNRFVIIIATSLLAGSITAFAGPIAFVGLAVPHLIRQVIPVNNHQILVPAVILGGAALMLICDIAAQLPGQEYTLPINAITSLIGAPVVIWLLVRKRKFLF
ncbi:iron ABC transporter permease [Salegentibacter maritimus]|uniref:Iron ABC transporter permease n=1 Tax=Salegentibacter maritimus TaxID=2794347 RepID=A0ABS0TDT7_9FLAO|nr:iron ABC transporter permease [Salegentibacter maritimus]MBI6115305.1 iron ABC transporter permease [Salegentibacter maritimus]MBI6118990.1 iron ABC transporter permease [Salegentibacter maritimus]